MEDRQSKIARKIKKNNQDGMFLIQVIGVIQKLNRNQIMWDGESKIAIKIKMKIKSIKN